MAWFLICHPHRYALSRQPLTPSPTTSGASRTATTVSCLIRARPQGSSLRISATLACVVIPQMLDTDGQPFVRTCVPQLTTPYAAHPPDTRPLFSCVPPNEPTSGSSSWHYQLAPPFAPTSYHYQQCPPSQSTTSSLSSSIPSFPLESLWPSSSFSLSLCNQKFSPLIVSPGHNLKRTGGATTTKRDTEAFSKY